jgi:hypothetical protein
MKTILAIAAISALAVGGVIAASAQTGFSKTIGNVQLSSNWSQITMVPAGSSKNITALCDTGAYPTGGGYSLGSHDLQVTGSHAYAAPNGTAGWLVSVTNNNATAPLPANVDVLCLSEVSATSTTPEDDVPVPSNNEQESSRTKVVITADGDWSGAIQDSEFKTHSVDGSGDKSFPITCESGGIYSVSFQKVEERGDLTVKIVQGGDVLKQSSTTSGFGVVSIAGTC